MKDSFPTVTEMVEAQLSGSVSSVELLDECVRQVERLNPEVNAVVTIDLERAYAQARGADASLARGEALGPLHGVPFTVKDAIRTGGIRSTGGAEELSRYVPRSDAPAVASLRAAGGVLFGKTNAPTWCADIQTANTLFGTTRNPWNLSCTSGGSSGGAAAAVAAGMSGFDLGTDIGGSIRIPASYCGVYGHKPSFGVVPQEGYLDHPGGGSIDADVNVFGPIARSIADLSTLLDVLARPTADNAPAWRLDLPAAHASALSELRVGIWLDDPAASVAREVKDVFDRSVAALDDAGARLIESHPGFDLAHAYDVYAQLVLAASALSRPADQPPQLTHTAWLELTKHRAELRHRWTEWFHDFDILLCPVMPMAPFPHDLERPLAERVVSINGAPRSHMETTAWTGIVGVAYLPSTVVRAGRTQAGLPIGLQVVGQYLHDRTTLRAASLIDAVLGPWEPPPGAAGSVEVSRQTPVRAAAGEDGQTRRDR